MRLSPLNTTTFTPEQRELSDRITSRRGATRGPFLVWLRSPEMCDRVEALASYARFDSRLPAHLRELSLLMAARHFDAQYSWNAHVGKAESLGVPAEALKAIAQKREPQFPDRRDATFYRFSNELLRDHLVSDETFAEALAEFGEATLVDIVGSLGYFTTLAMCLNAFQMDLQDVEPPFPDVHGYAKVGVASVTP